MTLPETLAAIQRELHELEQISFVANRDTREAMALIETQVDESTLLEWVRACKALFLHDRDAGKAFIRGSVKALEASGEVIPWTEQAGKFLQWRGSWKAVDGFMENLADAYGLLGKDGEARWAALGIDWCGRHLDSGVAYFRTPVRELAGRHGIRGVEELLAPAEDLFKNRRLALGTYLAGAIRVRTLLGVGAVAPWAKRGADILQAGRLRGESFFKLESEESISILLENMPGFRLPEHQRLLQLLVLVWFGEAVDLLEGQWSPDQGRPFVETDAAALYLPIAMPTREDAILGVLHAAGHLAFHSYERRHMEALFNVAGQVHPPLDEDQRITWRPLFAGYGEDMIRFQLIFDLCEDLRVDWRIHQLIPNYLNRMIAAAKAREAPEGMAQPYYALALQTLEYALLGTNGPVAPGSEWEKLTALLHETTTIVDAFRVANELYRQTSLPPITLEERQEAFLPGRSPNAARPVYPRRSLDHAERGTGELDREDRLKNDEIRPNPDQKEIPKDAQGNDPDMDIPPEETSGSGGRVGVGIPQPAHVYGYARGAAYSEKGTPHQEWDYRDGRYKRNWAWVQEKRLDESNPAEAMRLLEQYGPALKRLKRAIQSQKPSRMAPLRRQFDGDELDLEATMSYIAEKRAGMSPKASIYRQRVVQHRDTAVTLLADLSTSIMQQLPEGGGRVVDRIRAGVLLFAESMEEVGDPYSIAGFASKYRDNVSYYPIKGFNERLSSASRATIGGLSGRLATRMGAAIRHAVKRFDDAPSHRRLLLILSDGRPADYDDGGDERYLHEDTRMAVKEAVDRGVHPFCITLDPGGGEYLPQIFGPGHYLVLDHINDLPKKLPEMYLRLRK
jgi:nitric oxide reductase NorD protein